MFIESFKVESPNVKYTENEINSVYDYETTEVVHENRNGTYQWVVKPKTVKYDFKTDTRVPKLGVMLVGWGGNNGSTLTAGVIANKEGISWATKDKVQQANYFGSLTQASSIRVGSYNGEEIYAPFKSLLPMVNPEDVVFGGWDISDMNLADAMARARVLDIDLQKQLRPYMENMIPLPGIYDPDFIAANQGSRANSVIKGTKKEQVDHIIKDMREFKEKNKVDKLVVLWTANTERYSNVIVGLNDTTENLLASVEKDESEISPSTLYAIACVLEGIPFINGSPQNTFVPGLIELAISKNCLIGGDDFKSGQTKMKSVLVDFLVGAGIKPTSIVSYNHLGNNDGMNLSAPQTFRSKEISKSNVVDDMVASNGILFEPGEHPDHVVVIKYVPYVADSKRAMDEYTSEIFMGGRNTIVLHNTCEDSLLAAPIILDLVLLAELSTRIQFKAEGQRWMQALVDITNIAGEDLRNGPSEAAMVVKIANDVSNKLISPSNSFGDFVGIEAHLEAMNSILCLESKEARMVGIWGPSGIGKSTIGKALYSQLFCQFHFHAFVPHVYSMKSEWEEIFLSKILGKDIKIGGKLGVVEQMLNQKKVLIVLDDVDDPEFLKTLVGETKWFGPGSRIIVITQDMQLLKAHDIDLLYEVKFPSLDLALKMLCRSAFGENSPPDDFKALAFEVAVLAGNLPLGLSVLGSSLKRRTKEEWMEMMPRFRNGLNGDIMKTLRVSYDRLHQKDQDMFLYIACLFNGFEVSYVNDLLEDNVGVTMLVEKSLIRITPDGDIEMHNLLEKLGIEIDRAKSKGNPGKRRFLTDFEDTLRSIDRENWDRNSSWNTFLHSFPIKRAITNR